MSSLEYSDDMGSNDMYKNKRKETDLTVAMKPELRVGQQAHLMVLGCRTVILSLQVSRPYVLK